MLKNIPDVAVAQRLDRTRPVRQGRNGLGEPGRGLGRGRGDGVVHGGVDDGAEHAKGRGARGRVVGGGLILGGQQPRADAVPPDLVDLLVTNAGVHAPSYAPRLLAEMYAPEDHDLLRAEL